MNAEIGKILNYTVFGNSVLRYVITVCVFAVGMLFIKLIVRRFIQWVKAAAKNTVSTFDDFLARLLETIIVPLLYLAATYLAIKSLVFSPVFDKVLNFIILGALVFIAVKAAIALVSYTFTMYLKKQGGDAALEKSLSGTLFLVKAIIWAGAAVFFLDNLGFKISAVIAGLGIGGIAVALALQAILKDVFSYFAIIFDHPFKVGDFIIIGDFMGSIEYIGIKTTRIRSLGGEMLIFSNSDLTDSRVRNYALMQKRRVVFKIGVVYQTPLNSMQEIPSIIETIIRDIPDTVFDRAHFLSFGDFSLVFEIVYYVNGADYNKYMDVQQHINFGIMKEFEKRAIAFAYPTQTIIMNKNR